MLTHWRKMTTMSSNALLLYSSTALNLYCCQNFLIPQVLWDRVQKQLPFLCRILSYASLNHLDLSRLFWTPLSSSMYWPDKIGRTHPWSEMLFIYFSPRDGFPFHSLMNLLASDLSSRVVGQGGLSWGCQSHDSHFCFPDIHIWVSLPWDSVLTLSNWLSWR